MKKSVDQLIRKKKLFMYMGFQVNYRYHCLKLGCVSMTDLEENYNDLNYFETFFSEETIYIIRLKDVYEKWESGYMTELINHETDRDKEELCVYMKWNLLMIVMRILI